MPPMEPAGATVARLPRLALAGHPHHVLQRGTNREPIFRDAQDRSRFLGMLAEAAQASGVALHAYVLLDDHFHLLLTPATDDGLPTLMQALGRRYVRHYNVRHGRRGTLWEGRYRAAPLQADRLMLPAMVFIDQHPVRSGLAGEAAEYPWSSHGHYVGLRHDGFLTPPPALWQLANTPFGREAAYRDRVAQGLDPESVQALTHSARQGWALGDPDFLAELQRLQPRRLSPARRGRPRRSA